jgi:hypothetical protein
LKTIKTKKHRRDVQVIKNILHDLFIDLQKDNIPNQANIRLENKSYLKIRVERINDDIKVHIPNDMIDTITEKDKLKIFFTTKYLTEKLINEKN